MQLHQLLDRLRGVKKNGAGFGAECPAHDDQVASLSVAEGDHGGIVIHCHAGCPPEAVCSSLGLSLSELMPEETHAREVTAWEIREANGKLVAIHKRIDLGDGKKRFWWDRPGGKGLGGRKLSDLPLYRSQDAPGFDQGRLVYLVEGEKACDALRALGVQALATVTGASATPSRTSLEVLRGARARLWPDNDEVGRGHMNRIAQELGGLASEMETFAPDGLPPGGDAVEWVRRERQAGLGLGEIRAALESAGRVTPEPAPPPAEASGEETRKHFPCTDVGNAERLVARFGDVIRHSYPEKSWYRWSGTHWGADQTGEVERLAVQTVRQIYLEAAGCEQEEIRKALAAWAHKSESVDRVGALVRLARSRSGVPILPGDFDTDPWLLNCRNGTLDLRTLELRPHRKEDLCSKLAPVAYDPRAACPAFDAFLAEIFERKAGLIDYVWRVIGYCLTGRTSEHAFFIAFGTGRNGKGTLLRVLAALLGDYARSTDFSNFESRRQETGPRNGMARLKGARLVYASENNEGRSLSEATIKRVTGDDPITASFLYAEEFEYVAEFKVILVVNHKPVIKGTDPAVWSRPKLIPFEVFIPPERRDQRLTEKLTAELPGVLAKAARACREWQEGGLGEPAEVRQATQGYREEMDTFAEFLDACCAVVPGAKVSAASLYDAYRSWCVGQAEEVLSQKRLGGYLSERGIHRQKDGYNHWFWLGIRLKSTH
jgi:putative DNA primase/helicase